MFKKSLHHFAGIIASHVDAVIDLTTTTVVYIGLCHCVSKVSQLTDNIIVILWSYAAKTIA